MKIYEIENLTDARNFLSTCGECKIILTNKPNSTKYYGMLTIDYIFTILQQEFSHKIAKIILNIEDDHAALITSLKRNYEYIKYTGNSNEVKKILSKLKKLIVY